MKYSALFSYKKQQKLSDWLAITCSSVDENSIICKIHLENCSGGIIRSPYEFPALIPQFVIRNC